MERTQGLRSLLFVLENEFGIKTNEDLDRAIEKLGTIDLSPFCGEIKQIKGECQ